MASESEILPTAAELDRLLKELRPMAPYILRFGKLIAESVDVMQADDATEEQLLAMKAINHESTAALDAKIAEIRAKRAAG